MTTWTLYDTATGVFTGQTFSGSEADLAWHLQHLGEGIGALEGEHDHLSTRLDIESQQVVDYQPPQPADDAWQAWEWDGTVKRWISQPMALAKAAAARARRDELLAQCDWVVIRALDRGQAVPADWAAYRQALRDLPATNGFPDSFTWPSPPGA